MKRRLLAFALLLCIATTAFGWGRTGHRLIGQLAQDELRPTARREVDALLAGEPEPTLAGVAVWADDVRANDPVLGRRSAPWHYVTVHAPDCSYDARLDCAGGHCVVGAIEAQASVLADRGQPLAARRQALKFVVHFIGDAHQPLHANNRNDRGGNLVQVRVPAAGGGDKGSNLHALWDSGLMEQTGLDEPAYLARLRAVGVAVDVPRNALPPAAAQWAEQSCRIAARPGLYPASNVIGPGYLSEWTPLADEQMRRAATRLAQVLNATLAP